MVIQNSLALCACCQAYQEACQRVWKATAQVHTFRSANRRPAFIHFLNMSNKSPEKLDNGFGKRLLKSVLSSLRTFRLCRSLSSIHSLLEPGQACALACQHVRRRTTQVHPQFLRTFRLQIVAQHTFAF